MKRMLWAGALMLGIGLSTVASAKCYHYDDSLGEIYVCVGKGGDCTYHNNSVCCSNYCVYSTNTCK